MADKPKLVTGLFPTRAQAERAVNLLAERGYRREDITVLMADSTRSKEFGLEKKTHAGDGAGIGSAVGGAVGATLGVLAAGAASIALPGIGLVIAGPLAAALAGAGAGAATGGIIGMLVGAGIPEHRAKVYEAGLKQGGILLGVEARTQSEADLLEDVFEEIGAEGVRQE
jgi:hypothetical protein